MKRLIQENKKVIWIIISILLTIGLNMTINISKNKINFDGNQIIWLFICVFIYQVLKKANQYKEKRLFICSVIPGMLLAFFQTIGNVISNYWNKNEVILSLTVIFYLISKMTTYSILFTNIIKIIIKWIENIKWKEKKDIFKPTLKVFLIVACLFIIAWLPYFLNYYPGITSYDTNYQLMQGYEVYGYSNHHPVLHTVIITNIVRLGYELTNSYNFGIAIYVVLQMIVCASVFSFMIYYMSKKNIPYVIKLLTFIFLAFNPIVPQFSIAVWKDVPFTLFLILFIIEMIEIIKNGDKFLKNYKYNILFILTILGVAFFRNNGIYVIALTFIATLIAKRKYWKRILTIFIIPIATYMIITGPGYEKWDIAKGSEREMLSIPMQQMARISITKKEELTQNEKERIATYIPIEKTKEIFRPTISDPIKNEFNELAYLENKTDFFKLYIKLALKYPLETIASFAGNTYGYYYPEVTTFPVAVGTFEKTVDKEMFMNIETKPIIKIPVIDKIITEVYNKDIPIVSLLSNIGFTFWIILILLTYCIYKKKYEYILMYVPIAVLYLTCLASPVSGELRYIYAMFIALPLFTGFSIQNNKIECK